MSRIRSVHPGFFTDEDIVSVSMGARLLLIGLGVEADDKGVFLWKPKTIKMRVFPADMVDTEPLLDELSALDLIRSHEVDGRKYGAIRNFRKHQRPKKPNNIYPITTELITYVGLSEPSSKLDTAKERGGSELGEAESLPVPHQFPTGTEIPIQMEDGGWRMYEKSKDFSSAKRKKTFADEILEAAAND